MSLSLFVACHHRIWILGAGLFPAFCYACKSTPPAPTSARLPSRRPDPYATARSGRRLIGSTLADTRLFPAAYSDTGSLLLGSALCCTHASYRVPPATIVGWLPLLSRAPAAVHHLLRPRRCQ
ncbi:hypothetical protein COCNU_10G008130 [Cocos nucifera]|uniref:Secreted protein n=1 Tax=Cocos nucifera TaxID=13894 RepID=A0A8K0IMS2_COCNU|nr:hypothetical protein COCNU_10G008130 [Cocos nucifera]